MVSSKLTFQTSFYMAKLCVNTKGYVLCKQICRCECTEAMRQSIWDLALRRPPSTVLGRWDKKIHRTFVRCIFLPQRRPTFPGSCPPSIIGTSELNYCVRYGYRCVLCVIVTEFSKYDTSFISSLINFPILLGQALGLLVSVSLIHYCTYTSDLSTTESTWGLTTLRYGISYLGVGFTLRCLQRLSLPHLATQPCRWHDNWCTRGASIPVLSY